MLLEENKLVFSEDDLLGLVPYHARQIASFSVVQLNLNMYQGQVEILRIGDKLNEELKIPRNYRDKIASVKKYCTKPEQEMLFIIAEQRKG